MSEHAFLETSPSFVVSEDDRSDKSLCLDALVMDEEIDTNLAHNASRDNSDVTEPVSNTTTTLNTTASSRTSWSHKSATELTSLLEQATALSKRQRKRSNSCDSKRTTPSCFTGAGDVMGSVLYKSAPCLDFFDPYDQDPYLEEEASRKSSWWGDSEHRASYRDLQKDFSKNIKIFTASSISTKGTDKSVASEPSSTKTQQGMRDTSAPGQEFWLEDTEHSLLQTVKMNSKAGGSVTSGATEMAVAPNLFSSKLLASCGADNLDTETETVTTCPVTPSTVSRETVGSALGNQTPGKQSNLQRVLMTPKVESKSPKAPRTPKSTISMSSKARTPQTTGKKKVRVIKVRAAANDSEETIDASKVQEAIKKWKTGHTDGVGLVSSSSEPDHCRIPAALSPKKRAMPKSPGPLPSRTSATDQSQQPIRHRPKDAASAEQNRVRSSSCGRASQVSENAVPAPSRPRPRSLSRPRLSESERVLVGDTVSTPHPQVGGNVSHEGTPVTPGKVRKKAVKRPGDAEAGPVKSTEDRVRSKSLTRGKVRSHSMGRGEKLPDPERSVRSSTRSMVSSSGANDDDSKRARSRSLGRLGGSLFRRKGSTPEPSAPSPTPTESKGFLSSVRSLTHAVSRTPRPSASSVARSADDDAGRPAPRSRTRSPMRRKRVDPPPLAGSPPAPPPLHHPGVVVPHDASTLALCGPPTTSTATAYRPSRRPVPPRSEDLPAAIDVSPGHTTSLPSKVSSVEAHTSMDDHSARQRMRLLLDNNSFSEVSDDGLFQRIQAAGVTEDMMHRLRELGLIITEASPVAAAAAAGPVASSLSSPQQRPSTLSRATARPKAPVDPRIASSSSYSSGGKAGGLGRTARAKPTTLGTSE